MVTRHQAKSAARDAAKLFSELPYALDAGRKKSKIERRKQKVKGTRVCEELEHPAIEVSLPSNFEQLQRDDDTLKPLYAKSVPYTDSGEEGCHVAIKDNKLYRVSEQGEQLVLPLGLREEVLRLGHSDPWAGHFGQAKTFSRVAYRFYWPVGPLPRTKNGNRFILVIVDYATRYPEAFALKKVKTHQIVNALIQLISRVGVPREILTDQGTNFTSKQIKQVYNLLGIRAIHTTAWHPQTDGLTERFNKTLKQTLRKLTNSNGTDWDTWLPYVLFGYREVPQASTGFSPFELFYGRQGRCLAYKYLPDMEVGREVGWLTLS
ncbi:hypothetical protein SRHO_G00023730 [Serrasalmus rhombeus]